MDLYVVKSVCRPFKSTTFCCYKNSHFASLQDIFKDG